METLHRVDRAPKKQDSEGIPNPDKEICTSLSLDMGTRKPAAQSGVEDEDEDEDQGKNEGTEKNKGEHKEKGRDERGKRKIMHWEGRRKEEGNICR
jgi:hypothetical protein